MAQLSSRFCPNMLAAKDDEYHDAAKRAAKFAWPGFAFVFDPTLGDVGVCVMRVLTALLMVHHGIDKLENTEAFAIGVIQAYFPFLVFPYFFTYAAAATEITGSICLFLGIFARPASLALAGTMFFALAFHMMKFGAQRFPLNPEARGAYTYEPCLTFFGICLYFAFNGPGRFSVRPSGF